jgi:hypothetical protein
MTTKNVCVVVPDKIVSVDGETYHIETWSFDDSKTWAIQWNGSTKTGDIEPAPVNGKIESGNEDITESDYNAKVKPYVDAWEVEKARQAKLIEDQKKLDAEALATKIANRAAVRKLGKIPVENQIAHYPKDATEI